MRKHITQVILGLVIAVLPYAVAYADKPDSPGNSGKQNASSNGSANSAAKKDKGGQTPYFDDQRAAVIRNYFQEVQSSGNCPPGLAKKNNGCQPPGQAKKWQRGDRLPSDLIYYDLPAALLRDLGRTPEGQKIIRVGTAVLLINAATGLILDVIDD